MARWARPHQRRSSVSLGHNGTAQHATPRLAESTGLSRLPDLWRRRENEQWIIATARAGTGHACGRASERASGRAAQL